MKTVGFRASRGFWHEGKHVAGGQLILVAARKARELQKADKGKMILTRYPGRLDRGPVTFDGAYAHEGGQVYVKPEEDLEPGFYLKDEDCEGCPKKKVPEMTTEKPKKKRKKRKPRKKKKKE